jgi:hypothetical protein
MKMLSLLLIAIGIVLLVVGTVYPLATVIYATPTLNISPSFPSGTQATPTLLKGGALYTLEAYLTVLDVGSLTVKQVTITGTGYSLVVPLTWRHTADYDKIDASWTTPVLPEGTLLTFVWHVEAGTYKADATSYGKIGGPVGKFYINGQEANIDSVFTVSSPTLTFSFKATQYGDLVVSAWVGIKCDSPVLDQQVTLTETTTDTEWTGTFTLPSRGTYTLLGYISYGGNSYRLMSVFSSFNVSELNLNQGFKLTTGNVVQIAGATILVVGIIMVVLKRQIKLGI